MLRDEDVRAFRDSLEDLAVSAPSDARVHLELIAAVHTLVLDAATSDAVQFFSSYRAKHRFVCTRLRMDPETARTLALFLNLATNPRAMRTRINAGLPGRYAELLHIMLSLLADPEADRVVETSDDARYHARVEPRDDARADERTVDGAEDDARSSVFHDPTDGRSDGITRLIVSGVGQRMQTANGEIHVLHCVSEDERDVRLALTGHALATADVVWEGAVLHVTHVRVLDAERLVTTSDSLCVLEPDVLVDVTDIAECFQQRGVEPRITFIRRWNRQTAGPAVVLGSIINSCFDDILQHPEKDTEAMFRDACMQRPLSFIAAIPQEDRVALYDVVEEHVQRLRLVAQNLSCSHAIVEPSFLSPEFGLQGRLDVLLEHDDDPLRKTIIELKSGSAPSIAGTGSSPRSRVWRNHEVQIACYHLLLQSAYPARYGDSEILYSKADEQPLRNVDIAPALLHEVMHCRNTIVRMEYDIRMKSTSVLREICGSIPLLPSFMTTAHERLRSVFAGGDEDVRLYAHMFLYMLVQESYCQRIGAAGRGSGFSALWNSTITEKKVRNAVLGGLRLIRNEDDTVMNDLLFERPRDTVSPSVFRVGDIVIVYPLSSDGSRKVYHGVQRKGSIRHIDAERVLVRLRGTLPGVTLEDAEQEWICEPDHMESSSSSTLASFMRFFEAPSRTKDVVLGRTEPQMRIDDAVIDADDVAFASLNDEQRRILSRALRADDYFLLQGPPGTGKTSVMLRAMVRALVDDGSETILVAAYTNRAVDEICRVLKRDYGDDVLMRMGRSENTEHPDLLFQTLVREHGIDAAEQRLRSSRIIVATVTFLNSNPELSEILGFTTAIIDEAGQILEPHLVGIIAHVRRFILIGDEKQLPPVLSVNEVSRTVTHPRADALGIRDLQISLFERLLRCCMRHGWSHAYGMLSHQGRMHREIGDIASDMFYGGGLRAMSEHQFRPLNEMFLSYRPSSSEQSTEPSFELPPELALTLLRHRCVFVPTLNAGTGKTHEAEAAVAAAIATLFHDAYQDLGIEWNAMSLGIITPFRAQIQLIRRELPSHLHDSVVVDTVERFQGSERDIIIISTVVSSESQHQSIQSLQTVSDVLVDRKLNVALTRARERCIILGNERVLHTMPQYRELLRRFTR